MNMKRTFLLLLLTPWLALAQPGPGYGPSIGADDNAALNIKASGPSADSFGRFRISQGVQLFSGVRDFARGAGAKLNALRYDSALVGGGLVTNNTNGGSTTLSVTAAAADSAVFQTKQYFLYRAGQSQMDFLTFHMGTAVAGVRKRVGLFDAQDGVFLEQTPAGLLRICSRSYVTGVVQEDCAEQADWHLDPMDGTGPSNIDFDVDAVQILVIDLQWLGVGRVRVGFDIGGTLVYAHAFDHANEAGNTSVYMRSATLPLRWEITNVDGGFAATLTAICGAVMREGAEQEPGIQSAVKTQSSVTVSTAAWTGIMAFRLKSDAIRASLTEFAVAVANIDNTNAVEWQLVLNPTIAGGGPYVYSDVSATSIAERSFTTGVTITDGTGHRLMHGYALAANRGGSGGPVPALYALPLVANIAGTADVAVLAVRALTGTAPVFGSVSFRELY